LGKIPTQRNQYDYCQQHPNIAIAENVSEPFSQLCDYFMIR